MDLVYPEHVDAESKDGVRFRPTRFVALDGVDEIEGTVRDFSVKVENIWLGLDDVLPELLSIDPVVDQGLGTSHREIIAGHVVESQSRLLNKLKLRGQARQRHGGA